MSQQYNFEKVFDCKEQMNQLEQCFNDFEKKNKRKNFQSLKSKLNNIKSFLYKYEKERLRIFKGTPLAYSDCFALSVLTQMLAKRKEINLEIARPKRITHRLHALLVYKEKGNIGYFEIAGKTKHKRVKVLNEKNLKRRIRFTRPFINHAQKFLIKKGKIRTY